MKHLYIDTNAYLSFFHLTNDELEELKKLHLLLNRNEILLHLPEQTKDEFYRNRDVKIADALKRYREEKLNNQFPQFCKDYTEYSQIKDAIKNYEKTKQTLLDKLLKDIDENKLAADLLIEKLFKKAHFYAITDEILGISKFRFDLGRPPGKNKSYGDAINWETLLDKITETEDLYFASDDKDYYSEINSDNFNHYLFKEWQIRKKSKGLIHNYLVGLLIEAGIVWSTRINVDTQTEKEEFVYTILTRTVSLLIIVVYPNIHNDYVNIIKQFVEDRLIRWDEESEIEYQEIKQTIQAVANQDDQDNTEDNQVANEENIDTLIV